MATNTPILQILADAAPTQPTSVIVTDFHKDGVMTWDLQSGTVVHMFVVNGNTGEADLAASMLPYGTQHPWEHKSDYHLTNVQAAPHVEGTATDDRRSLLTLTFRKRPCPTQFDEEGISTLMSMQTWWEPLAGGTNPPIPKDFNGPTGISVLQPTMILKRTYPRVTNLSHQGIQDTIKQYLRHRNGTQFLATGDVGNWLFREASQKLLYGDPRTGATWQFTLSFIEDPIRGHAHWAAKVTKVGDLVKPVNGTPEAIKAVHRVRNIYPITEVDFNSLIATDDCAKLPPPE